MSANSILPSSAQVMWHTQWPSSLTASWADTIISASKAQALLGMPGYALGTLLGAHVLVCMLPQTQADIISLFTHPSHRRQGLADALMQAVLQRAKQVGCLGLTLEVRASNLAAQKLYAKHGFKLIHTRKNYYTSPSEDALVLSLLC